MLALIVMYLLSRSYGSCPMSSGNLLIASDRRYCVSSLVLEKPSSESMLVDNIAVSSRGGAVAKVTGFNAGVGGLGPRYNATGSYVMAPAVKI